MNDYAHFIAFLVSVAVFINTCEFLFVRREFAHDGIFSWRILQTRYTRSDTMLSRSIDKCCSPPATLAILLLRGLCAVLVIVNSVGALQSILISFMLLATLFMNYRLGFAGDGSDQMTLVVLAGLTVSNLFPHDSPYKNIGIVFIAAQSLLSYFVAGVAKLVSPIWRSGTAIYLFSNHATYGSRFLEKKLRDNPGQQKLICWATIVFECSFPLCLIGPKWLTLAFLVAGLAFHAGTALVMGLNCFFWAFMATYPAIWFVRQAISNGI